MDPNGKDKQVNTNSAIATLDRVAAALPASRFLALALNVADHGSPDFAVFFPGSTETVRVAFLLRDLAFGGKLSRLFEAEGAEARAAIAFVKRRLQ